MKFHQRLQTKGVFCCHCLEKGDILEIGILITNGQQNNSVNVLNPDTQERFVLTVPDGQNLLFNLSIPYEKVII